MKNERRRIFWYSAVVIITLLIACGGSRLISVFSENVPIERDWIIVVDPGHGGVDGGAISYTGISESRINLQISLIVNDLFHFLGYGTKTTRTEDISVHREGTTIAGKKASDLKERLRMVQETDNPVLLSIHQNSFQDQRYSGAQVFYADTENSKAMAEALQKNFILHLNPVSQRRAKECSGVYLMERVSCPALLIECGFLSNPEEETKLRDNNYQQKISSIIVSSVSEFLSNT